MTSYDLDALRGVALFGALDDDALEFLLEGATHKTVTAGEAFFHQGGPGESMFLLTDGEVTVERATEDAVFVLATLGPGECFGEMALIECAPRSATVRAIDTASAVELSFRRFHELYQHAPDQFVIVHMNMAREVCRRLRRAVDLAAVTRTRLESLNAYGLYM